MPVKSLLIIFQKKNWNMQSFRKVELTRSDYIFIAAVILLLVAGLIAIYSALYRVESTDLKNNFTRQILWIFVGVIFCIAIVVSPSRLLYSSAYMLYASAIFFLLMVLFIKKGGGISRWIPIAGFQFQPAELAKIATLLALSRYLSAEKRNLKNVKESGLALAIVLLPFFLIARQPDLGTGLVFLALILPVMFWTGLPTFYIFIAIAPLIVLVASFNYYAFFCSMLVIAGMLIYFRSSFLVSLIVFFGNIGVGILTPLLWNQLREYQQHRILTFLGLEIDPQGLSYQVIQSKVAIGSGGFLGKGLLNGTQTQLRFLPAQHTDFVFSVIGEELGFLGSLIVILLFLIILLRGVYVASVVHHKFLSLVAIGAVTILAFHVFVNIGMTIGIMPVTGIPLPFISYGGSFLIASMIFIGIIIHASCRRYSY